MTYFMGKSMIESMIDIKIDINGFKKFPEFNRSFKKAIDEAIKIEVNKIFAFY